MFVKLIATVLVFVCIPNLFAETIVLKNGRTIEGKIVEKNDTFVKINFQGVDLIYYWDDIKDIHSIPQSDDSRQEVIEFLTQIHTAISEAKENIEKMNNKSEIEKTLDHEIDKINQLYAPKSCERLKELAIEYISSMAKVLILEFSSTTKMQVGETADQYVQRSVKNPEVQKYIQAANDFGAERERMKKSFNIE